MVRGMKVKEKKFLGKGYGGKEISQTAWSFRPNVVKNNGKCRIGKDGQRNGGMLEVVEMVGGNGAIAVQWLVPFGAEEELSGDGGQAACHDKDELAVPELGGREP